MNEYNANLFPGIVRVEYFDIEDIDIDRIDVWAMQDRDIPIPDNRYNIPLLGLGEAKSKTSDGADECTLTFESQFKIWPSFRQGFIFYDANEDVYMLASKHPPYPKVEITRSFGKLPDARPSYIYTITLQALHTPAKVSL